MIRVKAIEGFDEKLVSPNDHLGEHILLSLPSGLQLYSAAFHDRCLAASSRELHLLYSKSVISVDSISHIASVITAPEELITPDRDVVRVILFARH